MKRHGRALHFAVTGALLGGLGVGCAKPSSHHVNTMRMPDPDGAQGGAAEDDGAAEGGAAEGGAAEGGEPDGPLPEVNPGPVDEPDPSVLEPSTNNVRKVDEPKREPTTAPADRPTTKYVNTVRVQDEPKP